MVPELSLIGMVFSLLIAGLGPIILAIVYHVKTKSGIVPMLIGASIFIVFALILESILHALVLSDAHAVGRAIWQTPALFVLYAVLAAAIFEEGGRLLAFGTLFRKKKLFKHGIAYGIGHGGIEAIVLVGLAQVSNLIYSLMINLDLWGEKEKQLLEASPDVAGELGRLVHSLTDTAPWIFFVGGVERIFTILFHLLLSVIMLYGVSQKKVLLIILPFVLHAVYNIPAAIYQTGHIDLLLTEAIYLVMTIGVIIGLLFVRKKFKAIKSDDLEVEEKAKA